MDMRVALSLFRSALCVKDLLKVFGIVLLSAIALSAQAKTVSNPNHKGWSGKHPNSKHVQWKPVTTQCPHCVKMTAQYNNTVQDILKSRYWVHYWREIGKAREKDKGTAFWPNREDADISNFEAKAVAANLELFELQTAQLELHKKKIRMLEPQAQYLRQAIMECESKACPGEKSSKWKAIKIGGERPEGMFQPDFAAILDEHQIKWKGPYLTDCWPCQPITSKLDALPGWVARANMQLQAAELRLQYAKLVDKSNAVSVGKINYEHPDKSDYSAAANEVDQLSAQITALKRLFEDLIKELSECLRQFCPTPKESELSHCPKPAAHVAITVGANADLGSKANFKEKAKKKAAGLATKAITGLLGIGGGSSGVDGPATYKDPVKRKTKFKNKQQKREIRVGGVFTSEGLLVSTEIKKAPGKGTFQTVFLENVRGWQLLPIRLYLYEIWRDWKLNVSWTKDTYVNDEHVKHEEGGWSESWSELIAKGEEVEYGEFPIWEQLGFTTAVSGTRSLGTLFPISPEMLTTEPFSLVVHISDPKKDPVITVPYIFHISLDKRGKVVIEEAEETLVSSAPPCEEISSEAPPETVPTEIVETPTVVPASKFDDVQQANSCPEGWACLLGKVCPPIENCTTPSANTQPDGRVSVTDDDWQDPKIEEVILAGRRIKTSPPPSDILVDTPNPDAIEELEITGGRMETAPPPKPTTVAVDELEEISATGTRIKSFDEYRYGSELESGYDLSAVKDINAGYELETPETIPPTLFIEEEDPPIVGIVLKHFDPRWWPRYGNNIFIYAKMYVPHSSEADLWVPHKSVKRKMEITFIARSNEKGQAVNYNLPKSPQTTPDLFFNANHNFDSDCTDDPIGTGHFGTCTTKTPSNEQLFIISSEDYGGFSRLDVSCEGCVSLRSIKDPHANGSATPRWGNAKTEPNRALRAVYVPTDDNRNQIADGHLPDRVSPKGAGYDGESVPAGNGVDGDGFSAYEEYRGFINRHGTHVRTNWDKKTLIVRNNDNATTALFETASGLELVETNEQGMRGRIANFNSGHAHKVNQHGLLLQVTDELDDDTAGYCFCDRERPKGAQRVTVAPKYKDTPTTAHELGHAVGMSHHGEEAWPKLEPVRFMSNGIGDFLPGAVHSDPKLCGKQLPGDYRIGTKGDQASGHIDCIMRYQYEGYVYKQDGGDYDCMPATTRSIFDNSTTGTGANGFQRNASDATLGNCLSQMWINSQ